MGNKNCILIIKNTWVSAYSLYTSNQLIERLEQEFDEKAHPGAKFLQLLKGTVSRELEHNKKIIHFLFISGLNKHVIL